MTTPDEHRDEIAAQEELIRSIDFLRDLDRVDVARLIGAGGDMHFEPGAVILREVEAGVRAYGADRSVTSIKPSGR